MVHDLFTKCFALFGVSQSQFIRTAGNTKRLRSDAYTSACKRFHRKFETEPIFANPVLFWYDHILETDAVGIASPDAHFIFLGAHTYAWPVFFNNKSIDTPAAFGSISLGHNQVNAGAAAIGAAATQARSYEHTMQVMLPPQNGAPLRLVVPWKYGFKSGKSLVKIRFTDKQPVTSWEKSAPQEYGFYSNVNPNVDHPRWSQATERRIGEDGLLAKKRKTLMFNGYEPQVGQLYAGMDLKKFF